jgi:hypothetical protein
MCRSYRQSKKGWVWEGILILGIVCSIAWVPEPALAKEKYPSKPGRWTSPPFTGVRRTWPNTLSR